MLHRLVRLPKDIVDKVEKNKKKTGVSISAFFTMAAKKELSRANVNMPLPQRNVHD